jgi:hypothetical protein
MNERHFHATLALFIEEGNAREAKPQNKKKNKNKPITCRGDNIM